MQADGGLVEHVEHAAQLRADLRGQANALRFAAGERGGGAVQAEVAEADGEQKIEARGDFGQGAAGDVASGAAVRPLRIWSTAGRASEIASAVNSEIERPPTFTARLSGRRRRSPHTAHGTGDMYCVIHSR